MSDSNNDNYTSKIVDPKKEDSKTSNVESETVWIIFFYIISSILLLGTLVNIMLLLPSARPITILLKRTVIIWLFVKILLWISIIYFPVISFYIFQTLYVNRQKKLF